MIIQKSGWELCRVLLTARREECRVFYGNGWIELDDYEERMWLYWIYGAKTPREVASFLQKKIGDRLTGWNIDIALASFKSTRSVWHEHLNGQFKCPNIPCYADPQNGLDVHISEHVCSISLDEECELLQLIAAEPAQGAIMKNMEAWFSQYCHRREYDFLKPCTKELVVGLCSDFLAQHGLRVCCFPTIVFEGKKPIEKKEILKKSDGNVVDTWVRKYERRKDVLKEVLALFKLVLSCLWIAGVIMWCIDSAFSYGIFWFFFMPLGCITLICLGVALIEKIGREE